MKDGRAGTVEMSAKNICLIGGTGLSILVALFGAYAMRPIVAVQSAKKLFYEGGGPKKVV